MKHVSLQMTLLCALALSGATADTVRVGSVVDGPWERNAGILSLFREEIEKLTVGEFEVVYPEELQIVGDWTAERSRADLETLMRRSDVDVILAMGVLATQEAAALARRPIPVIGPFVVDRQLQQLPFVDGASGLPNYHYLDTVGSVLDDVRAFQEIVPVRRMAFLGSEAFLSYVPDLPANILSSLRTVGVEGVIVGASGSAADVLAAIPEDVESAYVLPLPQLSAGEFQALIDGLNARRIATFAWEGRPLVEAGVLAGTAAESVFQRLARRTALNLQRILLGDDAATLPVAVTQKRRVTINMATARTIGAYPSFAVLTEAELLDDVRTEAERSLTLSAVMQEAADRNRDLAAVEAAVDASNRSIARTRAALLPQLTVRATGLLIDEDRAAASLGSAAERTITASGSASQVLWAEGAWAGYAISKHRQRAAEADRDATRLDIMQAAAETYLNVLIAKSLERTETSNLELTRSNLELAQIREQIGIGGPAEVHRWQSQIATNRAAVIAAKSRRNVAEIALNRLLHRPLEEPFLTEESDIRDPALLPADGPLFGFMDDPWSFKILRRVMAEEALANAPELAAIDALIAAEKRAYASAGRAFISPTVTLSGSVEHELHASGAGSGAPPALFPSADETDWSVALSASLPLTTGAIAGPRACSRTTRSGAWRRNARPSWNGWSNGSAPPSTPPAPLAPTSRSAAPPRTRRAGTWISSRMPMREASSPSSTCSTRRMPRCSRSSVRPSRPFSFSPTSRKSSERSAGSA